jgi:hypothetical protein
MIADRKRERADAAGIDAVLAMPVDEEGLWVEVYR